MQAVRSSTSDFLGLTVEIAVVQVVEDPAGGLVIRRPLAFPDSEVLAHARRLVLPHHSLQFAPTRWKEIRSRLGSGRSIPGASTNTPR
ncbi:hypothetical protein FNV62_01880 [Streptomyces sp. RLB3-17]|nr:hypothetical protein FNV62_01880 [Streptomyces sp. RLB3-17]